MKKTILIVSLITSLACTSQSLYACADSSVCSGVTGSSYEVVNQSVAYGTASFSSVMNQSIAVNFGSGNTACSNASFSNQSCCISDPDNACKVTSAFAGRPPKITLSCSNTSNVKIYGDNNLCVVTNTSIACT